MQRICYVWSPQHVAENADSAPLLMWVEAASNCNNGCWDLGGATAAHCWTMMLLTNWQQGNCFQLRQPPQNWIMTFFFHAVPTRGLFAQETKMPSRTFKSINETVSLLFIFTTWLALSSLITTPKELFASNTSPHCSGNYHWNLFYSVWLPMVWEHWNTYKAERLLKSKSDFNKGMSCFI